MLYNKRLARDPCEPLICQVVKLHNFLTKSLCILTIVFYPEIGYNSIIKSREVNSMENINWEQVMEVLGYTIGEETKKYLYVYWFEFCRNPKKYSNYSKIVLDSLLER